MQLSILIPVFNVAAYLPDLLQDLLPNLPIDTEVIFYDDASPDNSIAIIEKFLLSYPFNSVRILRGSKNIGLTRAREQLLQASSANYVWFVDSDDKINASALSEIFRILVKNQPDVIIFDYDVFFDESNQRKHRENLSFSPKDTLVHTSGANIYRTAIIDGRHYFWNKIFNRKLIENSISFDIPAFEDIAYTPVLLSKCQSFYYFSQVVVHYRIRKDSIAQKVSLQQAYGIKAYIEQAQYAEKIINDSKCRAYLLYKACIYYYRINKKISEITISSSHKGELTRLAQLFYAEKNISEVEVVRLLCNQRMYSKALKLFFYAIFFKVKNKLVG